MHFGVEGVVGSQAAPAARSVGGVDHLVLAGPSGQRVLATVMRDVPHGRWLRIAHASGASLFFMVVYAHVLRAVVFWLWGGFAVDTPSVARFFSLHFTLPFLIAGVTMLHLISLHSYGSTNPLGLHSASFSLSFYPYFAQEDSVGMLGMVLLLPLGLGSDFCWEPAADLAYFCWETCG